MSFFCLTLSSRAAQVHGRNQFLQTPLHIAAYDGNLAVADLLVLNGALVNAIDKNKVHLSAL